MIDREIARLRLHNQRLTGRGLSSPSEVVAWLGAVQAQDYYGSVWALGLRAPGCRLEDVERDVADGRIVRTWPMRGTLHFVPAADVRWMLDLLAPRAIARSAGRLRQLGLDGEVLARSRRLLAQALEGGRQLTRGEAYQVLAVGGISPAGQRGIHVLARLSQEGLLCLGPRHGRQPTFRLLEEWVPDARPLAREESLVTVAARYFASHGPATVEDFAWWSGLPLGEARRAVELAGSQLTRTASRDRVYWIAPPTLRPDGVSSDVDASLTAHLLPPYDEFTVAYRDRSPVVDPAFGKLGIGLLIGSTIALDGVVRGSWRRRLLRGKVVVTTGLAGMPSEEEAAAVERAAAAYGRFLGLAAVTEGARPAISRFVGRADRASDAARDS